MMALGSGTVAAILIRHRALRLWSTCGALLFNFRGPPSRPGPVCVACAHAHPGRDEHTELGTPQFRVGRQLTRNQLFSGPEGPEPALGSLGATALL